LFQRKRTKNKQQQQQQQQPAEEAPEGAAEEADHFYCGVGQPPKGVNRKAAYNYKSHLNEVLYSKQVRATAAARTVMHS
jgi:hypothetical protein